MTKATSALMCAAVLLQFGCDNRDTTDPLDVAFGDTALVVVLNPVINEENDLTVATPGSAQQGIELVSDDNLSAKTNDAGIAVLAPLTPGVRTISVSGSGINASFTVTMTAGNLLEIGLAATGEQAEIMVEIDYSSQRIIEIDPSMSLAQVNDALATSDSVVFVKGGSYIGDIDVSGSKVTLFGAGVLGGNVTLDGDILLSGSDSRVRGAHITGSLTIPASGTGLSFSQVDGALQAEGSDTTLLANSLCDNINVTGSGSIALGNANATLAPACP